MSLALLTPWQQLLWLVCAVILIVPVVVAGIMSVIRGYYNAKEQHAGRIAKALANAFHQVVLDANKKLDEALAKAKAKLQEEEKKE